MTKCKKCGLVSERIIYQEDLQAFCEKCSNQLEENNIQKEMKKAWLDLGFVGNQRLINGECLEEMKKLEAGSFDLILTDPPYGTMNGAGLDGWEGNKTYWDTAIEPKEMFEKCERLLRENGKLILFSQEPYTSKLITEAHNNLPFGYRMIWLKDHFANALIAKVAPVSYFEDVLIFSKKYDTLNLNPLRNYAKELFKWIGKTKKQIFEDMGNQSICHFMRIASMQFGLCKEKTYNDLIRLYNINDMEGFIPYKILEKLDCKSIFNLPEGEAKKSNVLSYKKDYGGLHPTQKPVELLKDLIKTYSNEEDKVLDFTAGSFSTLVACEQTNRNGTGIELDKKYCEVGRKRLNQKGCGRDIYGIRGKPMGFCDAIIYTCEECVKLGVSTQ